MVAYNFDSMLAQGVRAGQIPARTQAAREWFRDTAAKSTISPNALMKEDKSRLTTRATIGQMYAFFYDPKHKKTLPYYDRFPLIFKVNNVENGFTGINLHYLPPPLRAKLMDSLYELTTNTLYNDNTKLKLSYDLLNSASKFRYFKPTLKRYLNDHVKSRFLKIASVEWDMALFLPTERFEKATKSSVWKESRSIIRGR
jgi:hypothetical protein